MKIRYQAYAWDGKRYGVISVPKFKSEAEAIATAKAIIEDRNNDSVSYSVRKHYKEKPIVTEKHYFEGEESEDSK